ncbi:heme o synthase [bacterium]|nr:heme o synthase [bacterium]
MKRIPQKASSKISGYYELTKPSITFLILISTALGYYLGAKGHLNYLHLLITLVGSSFVSSGAGALNHYAESKTDKLMDRTKLRPIPSGLISAKNTLYFGLSLIFSGTILLLIFVNTLTAILSLVAAILYLFVYTPLKKITWLNTSIGAIPGAIPPVGGWVAASGKIEPEAWILFTILFLWQHPHFYAIALMYKDDYKKANMQMLPVLEFSGNRTNRQILWHALLLIPVSLMLNYIGLLGDIYFWGAMILGFLYLGSGIPLIKNYTYENARMLLKISVLYLPLLFLTILIDQIL